MTATLTESHAPPQRIGGLATLARNLGWSWNHDARALYRSIDPTLWRLTRHNPFALLRRVDPARLAACAADPDFLRRYDALMERAAREASNVGTWFATTYPDLTGSAVAYFCAEFGLHTSVPIYSGGLGILAGDQCKAAAGLGVLPTGSCRTGCTAGRTISGCDRSGSWAWVACVCCARWASRPPRGTPTKGTPRSCCSSAYASW